MGQIIAALDLGTSKSIALIAKKNEMARLSLLRTETFLSKDAMRRGKVYNSIEASDIVSKLFWRLNNSPAWHVEKVYVGIGGQSLRTQSFSVKRIVESGTISRQLLDSATEEANNYEPDFAENLGIASCEYFANGQLVADPKGTTASLFEARFQIIVGNASLKLNLENIFGGENIPVAGYFISPLATAEAVLTLIEKEIGCALIEFGEGVTYVSVYKDNTLKYMATLPLGSLTITKDIRSLNVSEEEAEALKIRYGSAISDSSEKRIISVDEDQDLPRKIELQALNWIIEARVDEIIKNVWSQIQSSGYSQTIDAGIVITGGGALLQDLPQFIKNKTGKEVRLAAPKVWSDQGETQLSPADSCVVGLAILGKENCVKENSLFGVEDPIVKPVASKEVKNKNKKEKNSVIYDPPRGTLRQFGIKLGKMLNKGIDEIFTEEDFIENKTKNKEAWKTY